MTAFVFIGKLEHDYNSLKNQFIRSFKEINFIPDCNKANAIFIKPNLTYSRYKKGVVTRIEFIKSFIAAFKEINEKATIYIGEGEGGYNSFSMDDAFKNMGYFELEDKFPQIKVINLSKIPTQEIEIATSREPYRIRLPKIFFEEIDFSISFPIPKVHCMTKISLSFKNQWGCLPDVMRLKNHFMFDFIISRISETLKFKYAFLDGKYALNLNGPMVGEPLEVNWYAASNSLGAFDMIVSEMMGFDWRKIGHLKIAAEYGLMPNRNDIEIKGEMELRKRNLMLKRNFWNYPALAAFHSRKLTHLFYFSRWAKLFHDIMYIFRKRPIS